MEEKTIEDLVEEYCAHPSDELYNEIFERTKLMGFKKMQVLLNKMHVSEQEVEQLIHLATFRAIPTYNKLKGKFSTWVYYFYNDEVFNYCMEKNMIRKPDYMYWKKNRERIAELHPEYYKDIVSLDAKMKDDSDEFILDGIAADCLTPEEEAESIDMREWLLKKVKELPPRPSKMIREYFGLEDGTPKTLQMLGDKYGVTRERIRQIIAQGLKKLRTKVHHDDIDF